MCLTAVCGDAQNEQAKLLFSRKHSTSEVSFAKENCITIKCTKVGVRDSIDIIYNGKALSFYADSDEEHDIWLKCCRFLKTFPNYLIPDVPRFYHKAAIKNFNKKYKDTGKVSDVNVVYTFDCLF